MWRGSSVGACALLAPACRQWPAFGGHLGGGSLHVVRRQQCGAQERPMPRERLLRPPPRLRARMRSGRRDVRARVRSPGRGRRERTRCDRVVPRDVVRRAVRRHVRRRSPHHASGEHGVVRELRLGELLPGGDGVRRLSRLPARPRMRAVRRRLTRSRCAPRPPTMAAACRTTRSTPAFAARAPTTAPSDLTGRASGE